MSAPQKLTKKQKKGLAFRDRKGNKSRGNDASSTGLDDNEVPVLEVQDLADGEVDSPAVEVAKKHDASGDSKAKGKEGSKGKGKEKAKEAVTPPTPKKRKREQGGVDGEVEGAEPVKDGEVEGPKRKKAKGASGATGDAVKGKADGKAEVKQRFILFVGNLKYTTTAEAIKTHFAACDPPPTVRLRTPKSMPGKPANKSKGCAFVEFSHRNALQQGLKLHQSELEGRRINVELTVGGGGKSDTRIGKLKERNKGLFDERKERIEKLAKSDPSLSAVPDLPQRFSATSGLEQVQSKRRTWTIGDEEDGETHRGGKKHTKERPRGRQWGTGVNAIPVG